jgi:cobalt-zinc-cadmium efflux system membrane fusion protein
MVGLSQDEIDRIQQLDVTDPQAGEQIRMVLPIRAPADGEVARFDLGIGQVINPNEHLFELHDRSRMWARGMLFEQDAAQVGVGQEVEIQLVSDPQFRQTVRVSRTSPIASAGERAIAVWAEVDNTDRRLREGMLARMVFPRKPTASDAANESPAP